MAEVALTLMSRRDCTLCEALELDLARWDNGRGLYSLEIVDIDRDADLQQRYTWRIPVLLHGAEELCAGHLTGAATAAIEAAAR